MFNKPLRVYYEAQQYISHDRAASDYRRILAELGCLTPELADADVVVLHFEPQFYGPILTGDDEVRRKYVIGYTVWETEELPIEHRRGIALLDEIWTPSEFCRRVFARYHPRVVRIPHVCRRQRAMTPADLEYVAGKLRHDPACFYYLVVADQLDSRKNAALVMRAFAYVHERLPQTRLIVKTRRGDDVLAVTRGIAWKSCPAITVINEMLSDAQLDALYELSNVVVSAHHAEAWGLAISDAMLLGRLVIVTGYSGNMDYTDKTNALLVDCSVAAVLPADSYGHFTRAMSWANPHRESLENQMIAAHALFGERAHRRMLRAARKSVDRFSPHKVKRIVAARLKALRGELRSTT